MSTAAVSLNLDAMRADDHASPGPASPSSESTAIRESESLLMPSAASTGGGKILQPRNRLSQVADIQRARSFHRVPDEDIARGRSMTPKEARVADFYEKQNAMVEELREIDDPQTSEGDKAAAGDDASASAQRAIKFSFIANCVVVTCKVIAAISSGSIAVIASAIDSVLDIVSASVLYFTERAMRNVDTFKFPAGKTRLEPLGIVLFACVMGMAAVQIIQQSASRMIQGFSGTPAQVSLDTMTIVFLCSIASIKLGLHLFCRAVAATGNFPSVEALAQDHLNDVALDSISLVAAGLSGAFSQLWFADPLGGAIVGLIILRSWLRTGREQISCLIGRAAPAEFIAKCTYVAATSSLQILRVDTVRAYHFGVRFLVEIDIVLPEDMLLREAHDIGEELERRIESLEEVERAYVHLDYEFDHKPERLPGQANRLRD